MPTNHNQSYLEVPRANHRSWGLARFSPDENAICPLKMCQTKPAMKVITVMFQWHSLIYDIASLNQHHPLGTVWSRWCSCGKTCTLSAKISGVFIWLLRLHFNTSDFADWWNDAFWAFQFWACPCWRQQSVIHHKRQKFGTHMKTSLIPKLPFWPFNKRPFWKVSLQTTGVTHLETQIHLHDNFTLLISVSLEFSLLTKCRSTRSTFEPVFKVPSHGHLHKRLLAIQRSDRLDHLQEATRKLHMS